MGDLTLNFSRHEFACRGMGCCGHSAPISMKLVNALQELRELVGQPLKIESGFRCLTHNREVDSDDDSQHPLGLAADVRTPPGMSPDQLAVLAERVDEFARGGIGIYPTQHFIHVDVRPDGPARWRK